LSLAAHLEAKRHPVRIFGRPMTSWIEHMPAGMFLKSEGYASSIAHPAGGPGSLARYCDLHGLRYSDEGWPVPVATFAEYGMWFQRRFVPGLEPVDVAEVAPAADGFVVRLATGETCSARTVVVAVGPMPFAHRPAEIFRLPSEHVSHTSDHADLAALGDRSVTVVGGGQSALESAVLLHEAGAQVHLVSRHVLRWPTPPVLDRTPVERARAPRAWLGTGWVPYGYMRGQIPFSALPERTRLAIVDRALGPAGSWWLRPRFGAIEVHERHRIAEVGVDGGKVRLGLLDEDGRSRDLTSDHVLAATGFQVDVGALPFLHPSLVAALRSSPSGPVLSRGFGSSVPGLHFTGLAAAPTFGPSLRFVCGTRFASARLARHLAARPG
jgi:hypothetical protein